MSRALLLFLLCAPGWGVAAAGDAGTPAPAEGKRFHWDVPKVLSEIDVPGTFQTNGVPNRFHVLVVGLPWEEVYWHFHRSFVDAGLWVDPPEKQLQLRGQLALTGFDPQSETSYTVILQPYPNGHTGVILGEAEFKDRTLAPEAPFAPVFPGAEGLITQNLESGRALSYRVEATPGEVEQYYAEVLQQSGFARQPDGAWAAGGELLQVLVKPARGGAWSEVAVILLGTGAQAGAGAAPWSLKGSEE